MNKFPHDHQTRPHRTSIISFAKLFQLALEQTLSVMNRTYQQYTPPLRACGEQAITKTATALFSAAIVVSISC